MLQMHRLQQKVTALVHNNMVKDLGLSKNHYFIHQEASSDILLKDSPGTKAYVEYFKTYETILSMKSSQIRESFISFFESKNHKRVSSAPVYHLLAFLILLVIFHILKRSLEFYSYKYDDQLFFKVNIFILIITF